MFSGFLAGLIQGILGVGSGSTMMSFLLTTPINTTSASATTGYQVLFIGMAALIEGFINGEVNVPDTVFFMGLCIVLGGAATLALAFYLKQKDQLKVSKIVVVIAAFLSLVSVVMVVPNVVTLIIDSGWAKIMSIKFSC